MARYRIETPTQGITTDLGNVHFHQGVAEVEVVPHWLRSYCEQNGYPITDTQPSVDEDLADGVPDDDNNPVTPPPGNASAAAWLEHVLAIGKDRIDPNQVKDMGRDQLKELAVKLAQEGQSA